MKEIPLTRGYVALVDDEDYERISAFKWCAHVGHRKDGSIAGIYAGRGWQVDGKNKYELLHRSVLRMSDPKIKIDHKNHNGLDCQKHNLRVATHENNTRNARLRRDSSSGFKGVSLHKDGKWRAYIGSEPVTYLGLFVTKEDAARAYNVAAEKMFGEYACLNDVTVLGALPPNAKQ